MKKNIKVQHLVLRKTREETKSTTVIQSVDICSAEQRAPLE